ncbi:MAG: cysteine-rich small domain-containing protein [Lachnospirales bacterium]
MKNSYRFFNNKDCKYFPCHKTNNIDEFNCLFCFCPLHYLGENCGGNFKYLKGNIKDCSSCMLPHQPNFYDIAMKKLRDDKFS